MLTLDSRCCQGRRGLGGGKICFSAVNYWHSPKGVLTVYANGKVYKRSELFRLKIYLRRSLLW